MVLKKLISFCFPTDCIEYCKRFKLILFYDFYVNIHKHTLRQNFHTPREKQTHFIEGKNS